MSFAAFAAQVPDLVPVLVAALTLLLVVRGALRRPASPRATTPTPRGANAELRALLAKGATVTAISRDARMPHDVVSLAVHLEMHRRRAPRAMAGFGTAAAKSSPRSA